MLSQLQKAKFVALSLNNRCRCRVVAKHVFANIKFIALSQRLSYVVELPLLRSEKIVACPALLILSKFEVKKRWEIFFCLLSVCDELPARCCTGALKKLGFYSSYTIIIRGVPGPEMSSLNFN